MANSFYNHGTVPTTLSAGSSSVIRAELDLVSAGFDKFPSLGANPNKPLIVNSGGTAVTVTTGTLSLAGNFTLEGAFNTTFVQQANVTLTLPSISGTLLNGAAQNGHLWGLRLLNNATDPTNDIDIQIGRASSTNGTFDNLVALRQNTSPLTKRLDATWVSGTNQGGRSSSVALSNTTYHVFLIRVGGVDDVGFDTSATATNLINDHAVTDYRRIGSILREGGSIVGFVQIGDFFYRSAPVQSVSTANPGTSAVTATLHVPIGIAVQAMYVSVMTDTTPTVLKYYLTTSLEQSDSAPSETVSSMAMEADSTVISTMDYVKTNTSGQVRYRISTSDADISVKINTHGWIDGRGVNDEFPS